MNKHKEWFVLSPRTQKIIGDLKTNKLRTLLVILSIAIGVFAIGTVIGANDMIAREMTASWKNITPPSGTIYTEEFEPGTVDAIKSMRNITEAEGRRTISIRAKQGENAWQTIDVTVIPDFKDIRIAKIKPLEGAWPPPDNAILIDQSSLAILNKKIGDNLEVETNDGKHKRLNIAGTVLDIFHSPSFFSGKVYGYITLDTLENLGYEREFDSINFVISPKAQIDAMNGTITKKIRKKMENNGLEVYWLEKFKIDEHPAANSIKPVLYLLGFLGIVSLIFSGLLVINTISALMLQQIRQIGIMKSIGARRSQIIKLYVTLVAIYGLLALLLAVPLGIAGAIEITKLICWLVNIDITSYALPQKVYFIQIIVGVLTPIIAALFPIYQGSNITVREAINSTGIGDNVVNDNRVSNLLKKYLHLSRPIMLSLKNTFRRKGRLVLTTIVLTLGGTIFITLFSLRSSIQLTLADALDYFKYDIEVHFSEEYRGSRLKQLALSVDGVTNAEFWGMKSARILHNPKDEDTSTEVFVLAVPKATTMIKPVVVSGRWLLAEDENALVINSEVLKKNPNLKIGDSITLKVGTKKNNWKIVGIVKSIMTGPLGYVNFPYYSKVFNKGEKVSCLMIKSDEHNIKNQNELAENLNKQFKTNNFTVSDLTVMDTVKEGIIKQFDVILIFLFVMVILMAFIGGLGLAGTMSMNVMERTREIGIMRSIGASTFTIVKIVLGEGLIIALVSYIFAILLAIPFSKIITHQVGIMFINAPFKFTYSIGGALIWLVIVLLIAIISTLLPAIKAAKISVREALAYE